MQCVLKGIKHKGANQDDGWFREGHDDLANQTSNKREDKEKEEEEDEGKKTYILLRFLVVNIFISLMMLSLY